MPENPWRAARVGQAVAIGSTPLLRQTHSVPIVFAQGLRSRRRGLRSNHARPGGNVTGFSQFESVASKWIEKLKEIAPEITRVGSL